jgi:Flp pilus assembly protein TadG
MGLDESGAVIVFMAVGMVALLVGAGLAIDAGRGYLRRAHLSRAVDAAALGAARSLRLGPEAARERAEKLALANGIDLGKRGVTLDIAFGVNELGEQTVAVTASEEMPTLLMKVIDQDYVTVRSRAVAAVPPVDLVLVLDQSGSLGFAGAWDDLKEAAKEFVGNFDDDIDQVGLVHFQARARHAFQLGQPFTDRTWSAIDAMTSIGFTNPAEGLRFAHEQLQGPTVRERSAKAVVFFTDGRPTAFRDKLAGRDRVLAAWSDPTVWGYWDDPDDIPMDERPPPDGCVGADQCWGHDRDRVFQKATDYSLEWANRIRGEGAIIYSIGLGDQSQPPGSILQPDPDYLRLIANEDGVSSANQPKGRMYFAPSALDLRRVFDLVAQDLVARLAQ